MGETSEGSSKRIGANCASPCPSSHCSLRSKFVSLDTLIGPNWRACLQALKVEEAGMPCSRVLSEMIRNRQFNFETNVFEFETVKRLLLCSIIAEHFALDKKKLWVNRANMA